METFWLNNQRSPELLILRPELKAQLIEDVYGLSSVDETLDYDLNEYEGLHIAVSDDDILMDFRLAIYSCA